MKLEELMAYAKRDIVERRTLLKLNSYPIHISVIVNVTKTNPFTSPFD